MDRNGQVYFDHTDKVPAEDAARLKRALEIDMERVEREVEAKLKQREDFDKGLAEAMEAVRNG